MGSFSILSLLLLFCLIPSCLILLWSSSQTAGTWWEATVSAVYSQKPDGVSTGGSPPGNNGSPSLPHGHGEEANHHLPSWLFSASTAACPAAGAGEVPASGCISCQGDGSDRATYWLLMWLRTYALVNCLGRCAKLAWTVFVLTVRRHWRPRGTHSPAHAHRCWETMTRRGSRRMSPNLKHRFRRRRRRERRTFLTPRVMLQELAPRWNRRPSSPRRSPVPPFFSASGRLPRCRLGASAPPRG